MEIKFVPRLRGAYRSRAGCARSSPPPSPYPKCSSPGQTGSPGPHAMSGISRFSRGAFLSMKNSLSLRLPGAFSGKKRSPGRRVRTQSPCAGSLSASKQAVKGSRTKAAGRRFLRKKCALGRACFPAALKRQRKRRRRLPRADVEQRIFHPCVCAGQMQPRARARAEEGAYLLHMDARNVLRSACLRKRHAHRAALQGGRQCKERRPVIGMLAPPRFGKRGRSLLAKVRFVLREQLRRGRERRYNRRVHIFGKVRQYIQPEPVARALPKKVRFIRCRRQAPPAKGTLQFRCVGAQQRRITRPRFGRMPVSPRSPVPRARCKSSVSA